MTTETNNGNDTVVPEVDRMTSAATDVPNLTLGRPQLADAGAGPVEGDQAVVTQEALLELEEFDWDPEEENAEVPAAPLPSSDWADLPSDLPADPQFFSAGQLALETDAGDGPQGGGIGEYREPSVGSVPNGLRGLTPPTGQDGEVSSPGFSAGAFGPSWGAGSGPEPAFPAPNSYNKIIGTPANDKLYGADEQDHVIGMPGHDRLYGGDNADWLQGGGGNDRIYGQAGADKIEGGDGNDNLYIDAADTLVDGGAGFDRVYVQGGAGVFLNLAAAQVEYVRGNSGNDSFDASGLAVAARLYGKGGDDTLLGGSDNDRLYGDAGADSLLGGEGNDRLYIDASDALIDGGDGTDTVYVQTDVGVSLVLDAINVENAYGRGGDDSFDASGLAVAARLYGKGGDDTLLGGGGNDRLYGDAGADSLLGGEGNDRLYIDASDALIDGGDGTDTVYVQTDVGVSLVLDAINVENAYGRGGDDSFDASGLAVAARLDGKGGADILLGGSGNDRLYGRGGDDDLTGGIGNDRLFGHAGADSLVGGEGNDRLSGGGDADSFVFSLSFNGDASQVTGPGADRILDFNAAGGEQLVFTDVIDIDLDSHVDLDDLFALEADDRLQVSESGSRVVLSFNGGGSIMMDGMATGAIDSLQDIIDSGAIVVV